MRTLPLAPCLTTLIAFSVLLAPWVSEAQPRRRPPARTAPRRRAPPPPPPPPPPQIEDDSEFSRPRQPTRGRDPFSDTSSPPERTEPEAPTSGAHHPRVDVELQYRIFTRSLAWDGDTMRAFRPYDLGVASGLRIAGELYPLSFVTDDALSHLAITGAFGTAILLDSADSRGRHFDTTVYDLGFGVRYRIPLAPTLPDLGVALGWTRQVFFVRASETQALGGVPDLVYDGFRIGLSARISLVDRITLRLDGGFAWVLSTGELGESFLPNVSGMAFDGNATLAVKLWQGLEVRGGFDVRAYELSANREEGDRYTVTGASDVYLSGTLGIAWRH